MKKVISVLICVLMVTSMFSAIIISAEPYENGVGEIVADDFVVDGDAGIVGISADLDGEGLEDEEAPPNPFMSMLPMILIMIAAFYFLMIRPNRKRDKQQKELLAAIKVSDEVVSIGGINGKVVRIKDDTFLLETGIGTQKSFVQIERHAISRITKEGTGKNIEPTPIFDDEVDQSDDE